jgi:lysozyme family protein
MQAMKFVAKWEGGWANDKADPGGKTNYGISDAGDGTIDGMIDLDRDGDGDVKPEDLTREQALQVYYKFYWLEAGCDKLKLPMAVVVFDTAVNCGTGRAEEFYDVSDTPKSYLGKRIDFYNRLVKKKPQLNKFHKGWINRVVDLRKYAEILET